MSNARATAFLIAGLALPVALFPAAWGWMHWPVPVAAAVAIAAGWAMNVGWAVSSADGEPGNVSIAKRFGWACPAVLVLLAWCVLRFGLHIAA